MRAEGFAWVTRDGYRLKIVAPYCPDEGEWVHALVRNGNRVAQEILVGKDAGGRVRVAGTGRRAHPSVVLATIEERHAIPGTVNDGRWKAESGGFDCYPGGPRPR